MRAYQDVGRGHLAFSRSINPADPATWADILMCTPGHELLYRFRDHRENLLYVGVTWKAKDRWAVHRKTKSWWSEVAAVDVECYTSDAVAHEAEYTAITTEMPRYNRHGVRRGDR